MTLPTLKDIETVEEIWEDKSKGIRIECPVVMREKLRELAIKWIREKGFHGGMIIEDWMEFFNITEIELRDSHNRSEVQV